MSAEGRVVSEVDGSFRSAGSGGYVLSGPFVFACPAVCSSAQDTETGKLRENICRQRHTSLVNTYKEW